VSDQAILDDYRTALTQRARSTGENRSRLADFDGSDEALRIIESFPPGAIVSADDVRLLQRVGTPAILGSAFRRAARLELIEVFGTTTARSIPAHSRLQRTWQRTTA
jgi:hypothetical protein